MNSKSRQRSSEKTFTTLRCKRKTTWKSSQLTRKRGLILECKNGRLRFLTRCQELNERNQRLSVENERLQSELNAARLTIDRMRVNFEAEVKELKFHIYSEEVKQYSEQLAHLEIRLKNYEEKRAADNEAKREESDAGELISKQTTD